MKKNIGRLFQGDTATWTIFFLLCCISLIEVYSAGATLTYKSGNTFAPLVKQSGFLLMGTFAAITVHNIPCRWFRAIPLVGYPLSVVLLLAVLFGGVTENDASRWIDLGFVSFQPSEIAKGVLVTTVAMVLMMFQTEKGAERRAFKWIFWLTFIVCSLIFVENFSTAAILAFVVYLMMILGRVAWMQILKFTAALALAGVLGFTALMAVPSEASGEGILHRASVWKGRIVSAIEHKEISPKDYDLDKHAQEGYSNIAIASSHIVGKGPGNSTMRDFLPQAFSDFIYAIIIEEFGLWGGAVVLMLYLWLLVRCGRIANRCKGVFPALLIMGLSLMLVIQALFNMAVAVGLAPVTGQPLPLISRGGTSTLITCVYFGMILSVSRYAPRQRGSEAAEAAVSPISADETAFQTEADLD